jgi:hypothetical protein
MSTRATDPSGCDLVSAPKPSPAFGRRARAFVTTTFNAGRGVVVGSWGRALGPVADVRHVHSTLWSGAPVACTVRSGTIFHCHMF